MPELQVLQILLWRWILYRLPLAFLALVAIGCSRSDSPYVVDTPEGPVDTRISPNGKTRPTIPDSTEEDTVSYYNPNTGTRSDYDLEVDRDSEGNIERINFPNGGWLEADKFDTSENADGSTTITTDRGYEYTVDND